MLALEIYEAGICSGCGFHHDVIHDPDNAIAIEETVCAICQRGEQYRRVQQSRDSHAERALGDSPPATAPRPADGRHTTLRLLSPIEAEARRRKR